MERIELNIVGRRNVDMSGVKQPAVNLRVSPPLVDNVIELGKPHEQNRGLESIQPRRSTPFLGRIAIHQSMIAQPLNPCCDRTVRRNDKAGIPSRVEILERMSRKAC